jgi:hypothetical protein
MMLCNRFAATVATLPVLKKEGFSPGFSSQVGKSIDLLQIAEGAAYALLNCSSTRMSIDKISNFAPFSTWNSYYNVVGFRVEGIPIGNAVLGFQYAVADGLSNSLTTCYALEKAGIKYSEHNGKDDPNRRPLANKDQIFTIHIVGAEADWQGFIAFEDLKKILFSLLSGGLRRFGMRVRISRLPLRTTLPTPCWKGGRRHLITSD